MDDMTPPVGLASRRALLGIREDIVSTRELLEIRKKQGDSSPETESSLHLYGQVLAWLDNRTQPLR